METSLYCKYFENLLKWGDLSCGRFIAVFGNHFTTAKTETGIPRSASFVFIAFATTIAVGCFARVTTAPYRCH